MFNILRGYRTQVLVGNENLFEDKQICKFSNFATKLKQNTTVPHEQH